MSENDEPGEEEADTGVQHLGGYAGRRKRRTLEVKGVLKSPLSIKNLMGLKVLCSSFV